jgi:hypothetical protein
MVGIRDRMFDRWVADLRDGVEILGPDSPAGLRMADTISYFEFLSAEMAGIFLRWQAARAARSGAESGASRPER